MNAEASRTRRTTAMMTPTAERRGSSAATAASFEVRNKELILILKMLVPLMIIDPVLRFLYDFDV